MGNASPASKVSGSQQDLPPLSYFLNDKKQSKFGENLAVNLMPPETASYYSQSKLSSIGIKGISEFWNENKNSSFASAY